MYYILYSKLTWTSGPSTSEPSLWHVVDPFRGSKPITSYYHIGISVISCELCSWAHIIKEMPHVKSMHTFMTLVFFDWPLFKWMQLALFYLTLVFIFYKGYPNRRDNGSVTSMLKISWYRTLSLNPHAVYTRNLSWVLRPIFSYWHFSICLKIT